MRGVIHPGERSILAGMRKYYQRTRKETVRRMLLWAEQSGNKNISILTASEINRFLMSVTELGTDMREEQSSRLAQVAASSLVSASLDLGGFSVVSPNVDTPWVRQLVSQRMASMIKLAVGDREIIRKILLKQISEEGFANVREIQTALNGAFNNMANSRSLTIARTETAILANGIRHETFRQEGIKTQEWVTAGDDLVRPEGKPVPVGDGNHVILDGTTTAIGETFANGLRYPGDPDGKAVEVINCRCIAIPVIEG